jgi:hypothetical protein
LGRRSGPQSLVVFDLHAKGRFAEKDNRIKGLTSGASGDTFAGEKGQKAFKSLFTRQMKWKPFEVVASSREPGALTALHHERKILAPNDFRKSAQRFDGVYSGNLIREPPFLY